MTYSVEQGSWADYWRENMEELGFAVPMNVFGSKSMIEGAIASIVGAIKQFGYKVTVRELILAGAMSEKWAMQGYLTASGIAGAMVGSAAVATGRCLGGGTRLADVFSYAFTKGWATPTITSVITKHPAVFTKDHPARPFFITSRPGPR